MRPTSSCAAATTLGGASVIEPVWATSRSAGREASRARVAMQPDRAAAQASAPRGGPPPGRASRRLDRVFALLCATAFAFRDNAVRGVARDIDVSPLGAAAASLLGATLATGMFVLAARRDATHSQLRLAARSFLPAGLLLALAYAALVAGFDRGSVGIVAPLNATQSLWGVVFAALIYRNTEAIGRRTVLASVLVVVGGVLIGVFR